jgi:hypothetical protein
MKRAFSAKQTLAIDFRLDLLFRRQVAVMIQRFELQSGMLDLELTMQIPGRLFQERTVTVVDVSHQMSGESRFRGAHRPNVEVMNFRYVGQAGEILSHFGNLNALRHGVKREINRIAQQSPGAPGNNGGNRETDDRIDPKPTRGYDKKTGDDNTQRNACVGRHVHEGRPNVEVPFAARHEH